MDQFSSMPLSQIAIDDSSPPIVHYGMHMPIAVSTPTGTDVPLTAHSRKILISRLSQVSLRVHYTLFYHHLVQVQSLCDKVSKGLDKYLQDTEQCHALEVNYFDDTTRPTNISSMSEATEHVNESSEYNPPSAKQESREEVESIINIPESLKTDTSHSS